MELNNPSSNNTTKIVAGIVAALLCCACAVILAAGYIMYQAYQQIPADFPLPPIDVFGTPSSTPEVERPVTDINSIETIETLRNTLVPENDPYELACRLQNICNVPRTVPGKSYELGDKEQFWILNSDTVEHYQITATLLYITPHSYFWAEDGAEVNRDDMKRLMDTFENEIYPTNREFFGSEPNPGVDGDPHVFVIYAGGLGSGVAGYFNSSDAYNPMIDEYSNAHETFMLSTGLYLGDVQTYGTLAHEFVHMIMFSSDRNEILWLSEGFAEVGAFLNGYYSGVFDWTYAQAPDLQLTDWLSGDQSNWADYGQSFLYLAYFLDRFGTDATKAVVSHPENDLASIDETLTQLGIIDPSTGESITADDVFMDWAATMWLMDESVGDGRYHYNNYPEAPNISVSEFISTCPTSASGSVNQYGIDYFTITCAGNHTLKFSGSTVAKLLPVDANSGKYAFWSNKGDSSDMTLTREFDFTGVTGTIEISYWTWYDIEEDWDYLFLEASTDGQAWEILTTPSGTDYNPSGNSYGWGYTGSSGDWIQEKIDLSQFAGQKMQIRFEYVTDLAVNGEGFLLDDIRVDAIGYQSDFEADDGGWVAEGFARVDNVLPQTYRLSMIIKGDTTIVTHIPVSADQTAEFPLSLSPGDQAILIVTGTTRYTRLPAGYQIEIE